MLGAIVGDIVGSPYEFDHNNIKTTEFPLLSGRSHFTDDTVMTLAVAEALMTAMPSRGQWAADGDVEAALIRSMRAFGARYPSAGYGGRFARWLASPRPRPYGSFGNGSAMRVSPAAWAFDRLEDVERCAELTARPTHDHPEGIKGAQATAGAILLARQGKGKDEIRRYVEDRYDYDLSRTLDDIRPTYRHVESCQETVPEALTAFLEAVGKDGASCPSAGTSASCASAAGKDGADGFEDCLRKAVSLGGDSDTLAAIAASLAEGAWGVPKEIEAAVLPLLDPFLLDVLERFEAWRA
ncbi:MAG: ADP-ribosylglycohydrolase family protein [Synergistaceae bacterium]|nr:ADP-ribosylglycohydrolase family protein [Synergistaceae bacterium]